MSLQPYLPPEPPPPDPLMNLLFGKVESPLLKLPILRAGIELQVWAEIAAGHQKASEVAEVIGADLPGMRSLLDALTVMQLLEKEGSIYCLPGWAEYYLLPGKPTYLGHFVLEWLAWEGHGKLAQAIRSGKHPIIPDVTRAEAVGHFLPFYAVRAQSPHYYVQRYAGYWQKLLVEAKEGLQVLDLACGVGIATHALALQHPGVRVTLQDWPAMLEFAMQAASKLCVEKQMSLLPGDMLSVDIPIGKFDIVRLGYVTYFFGKEDLVKLFRRTRAALKSGGMLVIEVGLSDEGRKENEAAILDGPWLYAISAKGDVYTFSDYRGFLEKAGFKKVTKVDDELVKAER
jgi:SAM-dependent methyltransferase